MKILLVEDDLRIASAVSLYLKQKACSVSCVQTVHEAITLFRNNFFDICVVDLGLPDARGEVFINTVRLHHPHTVLVVCSGENHISRKIDLLRQADDYITKPFFPEELYARLCAITRRAQSSGVVVAPTITLGDIVIDTHKRTIVCNKKRVAFRHKEFRLLECFMKYPNYIFTRNELLDKVWDADINPFSNTVDVHVQRLRLLIRDSKKIRIETVTKMGYRCCVID